MQSDSHSSDRTLIPRKTLFGNPDRVSPQLSPDGKRISFLAPVNGVLNVWVGPAENPDLAEPVTQDTGRGIRSHSWSYNNVHILYVQDQDGDENWHLYRVDLTGGDIKDLTPIEGVQAQIQQASPKFPDQLLVALNDQNPQFHSIYRINLSTGDRELIQQNDGFAGFITDEDFNVRFASRLTPDGGNEILKPAQGGGWDSFLKIDMEDALTTSPVGFDKTLRVMYLVDSRGRDTAALVAVNLDTDNHTVIAEDQQADVSDTLIHPMEKTVQAVAFTYQRKAWQILDQAVASHLEYLSTVAEGDVEVISRTLDDRGWIVAYLLDDGPVRYYHYDTEAREARFLFTNRKALEGLTLAKMHTEVIKSRDGLELVSYYTLPVDSARQRTVRPDEPLAMVLLVHGGPWYRDDWGYNPLHQLLANRGYAVLSVNFRGSTGLGKGFTNAGNREWGGRMQEDLLDAVQWAVAEGIADPEKIAIMGGSYGGYATLAGLTFSPEVFACGVDIVGISNLVTFMNSIPPYWQPAIELLASRVGDHRTEEGVEFLKERSPLTHVERISKPLLIGQGANDPRVKQAESDQIVEAMQRRDIPVTYVLYPDEGHGFARPENNLSFFAVSEAFLACHLGGLYEPVGEDFEGSSITIPIGDDYIPGIRGDGIGQ